MPRHDIDVTRFRKVLEAERQRVREELRHVGDRTHRRSEALEAGETSQYDQDMADLATEAYEREKDLLTEDQLRDLLDQIESALERLERGDYGECQVCSQPIALPRLEALPHAVLCIECQTRVEG